MAGEPLLRPSVITSSSILRLPALLEDILSTHEGVGFDLMVLRPEDIDWIRETDKLPKDDRITDLVADHDGTVREHLTRWLVNYRAAHPEHRIRVPALATYFPDISSKTGDRWEKACRAVVNSVKLCRALAAEGFDVTPCVEVVCGSLLEPVIETGDDRPKLVKEYKRKAKIDRLVETLAEVKTRLAAENPPLGEGDYAIALEVEPGSAYVLNDRDALRDVYAAVCAAGLRGVVGLNLDIAHFRIAGITPAVLAGGVAGYPDLTDWLVHSHIADHPLWMHTRDLSLGAFTQVERFPTEFCPYLDVLVRRAKNARAAPGGLRFTNAVALELEGCSRLSWVHESLVHLKRLLREAEKRAAPSPPDSPQNPA